MATEQFPADSLAAIMFGDVEMEDATDDDADNYIRSRNVLAQLIEVPFIILILFLTLYVTDY